MQPLQPVAVIEEMGQAACAMQPLRVSLLRRLATPASASSLARDMGMPRQKLNYHLNALRKAGLIEQVEERKKGNCTERVLQAKARSFVVSPSALGDLGTSPEQVHDRFSWGYLVAVCAQTIRKLGRLRRLADASNKQLATLTLETEVCFESAADRSAFANELATAFLNIAEKYHRPQAEAGRSFRVFAGAHPALEEQGAQGGQSTSDHPGMPTPQDVLVSQEASVPQGAQAGTAHPNEQGGHVPSSPRAPYAAQNKRDHGDEREEVNDE